MVSHEGMEKRKARSRHDTYAKDPNSFHPLLGLVQAAFARVFCLGFCFNMLKILVAEESKATGVLM